MIKKTHASAFFPASGATLAGDFQPQTGITAVVGENGAGKTFLTIETIRWLLYGKAALRGVASDYKQAEATGTFTIRGADYEISRGKHEWIKDSSGETIAKGAEKVTEKVTELMGYGLDVFDLCNAATQGNVQQLGRLRPAERKAIIDKVLRLTDAEQAEKDCRAEALGFRREAETLAKALRAPGDKPVEPDRYIVAWDLRAGLEQMRRHRDAVAALRAKRRDVEAPVKPEVGEFSETAIAELETYVQQQRDLHARHRNLTVEAGAYGGSESQIDAAEERLKAVAELERRGPKPTLSLEYISALWAEHHAFNAYTASEEVTCPKCSHTFRPTGAPPPEPSYTEAGLREQERRYAHWPDDGPVMPPGSDMTAKEIAAARRAISARLELRRLPPLGPDRQGLLETMRRDKAALEAYTMALLQFERVRQANAEIDAQIAALGRESTQQELDEQSDRLREAELYENACAAWEREDAAFKETQAQIVEASRMAEEYKLGAQGIADARAVIKALIAPKISRIATALIRDMSLNKLRDLVVDDDMEITVGGQRLETLSGAGMTVANLALRVAMGRALVGHIFPVFLADEIDGDMTPTRREATLQALVSLKKHLSQIILVTHRGADVADHVFEVTG
jgi:exonuclease SbcC